MAEQPEPLQQQMTRGGRGGGRGYRARGGRRGRGRR